MFMKEAAVRGVQEAGSGPGNSRRQLHALATGADYYGADNNARDCHYPGRRARAAVARKHLPRVVVVVVV